MSVQGPARTEVGIAVRSTRGSSRQDPSSLDLLFVERAQPVATEGWVMGRALEGSRWFYPGNWKSVPVELRGLSCGRPPSGRPPWPSSNVRLRRNGHSGRLLAHATFHRRLRL